MLDEKFSRYRWSWALAFVMLFATCTISAASQNDRLQRDDKKMHNNLVKEVRHQLLLLPCYSVFYNLFYKVDGDKVTLMGQVVRPPLKSDAENVVKEIEGVSAVDNEIQTQPVWPMDDQLRRAVYRAVYGRHSAVALWNVCVAFDSQGS